jgi:hypothetical protein
MKPSKFTNAEDQRKAERKRFEKKQEHKPVLGEKVKQEEQEQMEKNKKRFNSGDYE